MTDPLLVMRDVNKRFQGVQALSAASLEVEPGEIMALVGENGAGKSTMIKALTGAYRRDSGSIDFGGEPVDFASPQHAQHGGISTIYQEINLVPFRSVAENIFLGRGIPPLRPARLGPHERRRGRIAPTLRGRNRRAQAADGFFYRDPADGRHRPRRFVQGAARDHGRADLVARRARSRGSVRRDAPAARRGRGGHFHQPSARRALRGLRPGHRDAGRTHGDGEPNGRYRQAASDRSDAGPRSRDCARPFDRIFRRPGGCGGVVLSAEGLQIGRKVRDARVEVRERQIVGLAGLLGSGRTEVARAISAPIRPTPARSCSAAAPFRRASPPRRSPSALAIAARTARRTGSFRTCRCAKT